MKRYSKGNPIDFIKEILFSYLDKDNTQVFLFGSRARGDFKFNSDYDVCIKLNEKLPIIKLANIRSALKQLPWNVDVVDRDRLKEPFRSNIQKDLVKI